MLTSRNLVRIRRPLRALPALLPVALTLVIAACGSGGGAGTLIFGQIDGIVAYRLKDGTQTLLLAPVGGNGVVLRDPASSPDGKRVAYVRALPSKASPDRVFDASADLWVANRDGSDAHVALQHDASNQRVLYPQWLDDQHVISVVQVSPNAGADGGVVTTLERIDVGTGERQKLLDNVTDFGLSADRKRIVYSQIAGSSYVMMAAGIDTASGEITNGRAVVGGDQQLGPFASPRFSPDGKTITFAAPGPASVAAGERYVTAGRSSPSTLPPLHGAPQDVWAVDAAGGPARRLADVKLDDPALAYGADGTRLYILSSTSLDELDLKSGAVRRLRDTRTFQTQMTWVK